MRFEPELHLGSDILVPDLAGWRRERMSQLVDDEAYFTLAPDWVCKALSPSTAVLDRTRKLPIYAREHVRYVWFVDPLVRTLEVLGLGSDGWVLAGAWADAARVRAEPFDAIELELGILWQDVKLTER